MSKGGYNRAAMKRAQITTHASGGGNRLIKYRAFAATVRPQRRRRAPLVEAAEFLKGQ